MDYIKLNVYNNKHYSNISVQYIRKTIILKVCKYTGNNSPLIKSTIFLEDGWIKIIESPDEIMSLLNSGEQDEFDEMMDELYADHTRESEYESEEEEETYRDVLQDHYSRTNK